MDTIYTIICIVGSIASIIGLILAIINNVVKINNLEKKHNVINIVLYIIILILCIFGGVSYHKYKKEVEKQLDYELRKNRTQTEAKAILDSFPPYGSYFNPGDNEGIVFSTLFFLEKNNTFWPDSYNLFKNNTENVIDQYNKEPDEQKKREIMEPAANQAIRVMKSLAE